jgi:hypothetical protein
MLNKLRAQFLAGEHSASFDFQEGGTLRDTMKESHHYEFYAKIPELRLVTYNIGNSSHRPHVHLDLDPTQCATLLLLPRG